MQFKRNVLPPREEFKENKVETLVEVEETEESVVETPTEVVEEVEAVTEEVVEEQIDEPTVVEEVEVEQPTAVPTLEEKFFIPEFESKLRKSDVPDVNGDKVVECAPIEVIDAKDVVSIEVVDEVPDDVEVKNGVVLDGELNPEVQKLLDDIIVTEEEIPTQPLIEPDSVDTAYENKDKLEEAVETKEIKEEVEEPVENGEPEVVATTEIPQNELPKVDATKLFDSTWNHFVDHVIVPTLVTALKGLITYVETEVSNDLKKCSPEEAE